MLIWRVLVSVSCWLSVADAMSPLLNQDQLNIDDLDTADAILFSQSGTCTAGDDSDRIQCFRELPLPKYEIFEGQDVMMRCRVAHQHGKLQWAFKGKMLGFDRDIPTHPRIRMPGNPKIGDHSLFIENVKVSDSGNYECQLSPAASQPPRRRMTKLTVLKAPSSPNIYQNGVVNKNISVSIRKGETDSYINLTCVSLYGNPVPSFVWSVNNNTLITGSLFRSYTVQIESLNENTSFLSIKSSQILNGDLIKCGVSNAATMKRINHSVRVIFTEVRVFKRILPGKLTIKEVPKHDKTIVVTEGNQLQLSCICSNPGDPSIDLNWYSNEQDQLINSNWVWSTKNDALSQNIIKIPNITRKWHNKSLYCSGTQEDYPTAQPVAATIIVYHPPSKVDLEAISITTNSSLHNPSTVYCKEGQMVRLSCTSDSYYSDNVEIIWYAKNTEDSDWQKVSASNNQEIISANGRLKQLKSTFEITPAFINKDLSNYILSRLLSQVVCLLKSKEFNIEVRQQVKLELFEQPSIPVLSINDNLKPPILTNGESAKLKCSVTGGHPTPELHLLDEKNQEIKTSSFNQIGMTKLEYNIEVKPRDNGKNFRCVVFYKTVMDFMPLISGTMPLKVANPPSQLQMKGPSVTDVLQENKFLTLQCHTDASFPEAKIEWWWHHSCQNLHLLGIRSSSQEVRSSCQSEVLNDQPNTNYEPLSQSTLSTINIKLTARFDQSYVECLVVPHEKWTTFKGVLNKLTKLRVQYSPQFRDNRKFPNLLRQYTVEEGQNFSISIKSQAHPAVNGYTWLMNNMPIERRSQLLITVDKFSIITAQQEMMGNYTLLVENQLGKASFDFLLNITFGPKLLGPTVETVTVNPVTEYKNKFEMICSGQANPIREKSLVRWIKESPKILDNKELLNIIHGHRLFSHSSTIHCAKDEWKEGNVSINCISLGQIEIVTTLQILSMDYRYIGTYKCIFSNTIKSSSAIKTTNLVFPTPPIPIRNSRRSEFVSRMRELSQLTCYFVGFPIPTVRWVLSFKNGSTDNLIKYTTTTTQIQPGMVKATLSITETNEMDLGKYTCTASNHYGESSHTVLLNGPRAPTQPINITLINVTDTSISLGWILGFNGGSKQTIQLRWRMRDPDANKEFSFVEISEDDENDVQFYTIINLDRKREYEISIFAVNRYTSGPGIPKPMVIKTLNYANSETDPNLIQNDSKREHNKKPESIVGKTVSNSFLIIVLLAIVGLLLFTLKIGLIIYFIRKRRQKHRKTEEKNSSPVTQQMIDTIGYLNNDDTLEMRLPSMGRNGVDSNLYAQSLSDHLSQNGSDNGLKLNYYKTNSDDQFQTPYLGPELDLVASVMGRSHFDINALPANFHPAYIQLTNPSSVSGAQEPYIAGYFTQRPYYQQTPTRNQMKKPSHFIDTTTLPQYPISSVYQRRMDKPPYPQSAVSMSTASGESNCSQSPPRHYPGYSPLVNQSGAPSTVEEYLSSGNSASESQKYRLNGSDEYFAAPMTSFQLGQCTDFLNTKEYYSPTSSTHNQSQESSRATPTHGMVSNLYRNYNDSQRLSPSSDSEDLLKPPFDFAGIEPTNLSDMEPQLTETHKLNYVDLISHSSPSVIIFNRSVSDNL